jgi:hypothetical protein
MPDRDANIVRSGLSGPFALRFTAWKVNLQIGGSDDSYLDKLEPPQPM